MGITQENPEAYIKRYGDSLFDTHTLVQQARAAGVVEDIVNNNSRKIQNYFTFHFTVSRLHFMQAVYQWQAAMNFRQ